MRTSRRVHMCAVHARTSVYDNVDMTRVRKRERERERETSVGPLDESFSLSFRETWGQSSKCTFTILKYIISRTRYSYRQVAYAQIRINSFKAV